MADNAMKLSKAQEKVLSTMSRHGCTVHTLIGRGGGHAFYSSHGRDEGGETAYEIPVRPSTLRVLERKGLLTNMTEEGWRWRGSEYALTVLGIEAAKEVRR